MYIIKNSLRNIFRTKGRNILIASIVVIIAFSTCIGLAIRNASEKAKESALEELTITANINIDRSSILNSNKEEGFDRNAMSQKLSEISYLTLEEMQNIATAKSVKDFYYKNSISLNTYGELLAVTEEYEEESENVSNNMGNQFDKKPNNRWGTQGDFTITGYSSYSAMTSFVTGTSYITSGEIFALDDESITCIITEELATFNDLSIGDLITLENPNNADETYELEIVGIYLNTQADSSTNTGMMGFSRANDQANQIYVSSKTIDKIVNDSKTNEVITTDEERGIETSSAITSQITGTYEFATVEDYNQFEGQARDLGLEDTYTISSSDISSYEKSISPLENLSQMAWYFLLVVLGIGCAVLVVLNIFNIRERKYEVGVLTAIGMKKHKVALQFIMEIFVVTIMAVIIGGAIGAASSVKVTDTLLESQIDAVKESNETVSNNFGEDFNMGGTKGMMPQALEASTNTDIEYIDNIKASVDLNVLLQLLLISVALSIVASLVSIIFVMRYEPLKILSNRD